VHSGRGVGADVAVRLAVHPELQETGLEAMLLAAVETWVESDWPFRSPSWPGRE
jgi:GNAT superfamily N-acetyltransferase